MSFKRFQRVAITGACLVLAAGLALAVAAVATTTPATRTIRRPGRAEGRPRHRYRWAQRSLLQLPRHKGFEQAKDELVPRARSSSPSPTATTARTSGRT